jgi:nucleoside-diphosphate-sugar epimerase
VALDNFTVGYIGDMVKEEVEELTGEKVRITVKNMQDFRNYKVTTEKARTYLGFRPKYSVVDMVRNLHAHRDEFGDFSKQSFYNIQTFKALAEAQAT